MMISRDIIHRIAVLILWNLTHRRFRTAFCLLLLLMGARDSRAQGIYVSWNANEDPDLAGYKVYYGQLSRIYTHCAVFGDITETVISTFPGGGRCFFSVTAYDESGNESLFSEEAVIDILPNSALGFYLNSNYPNPFNPDTRIPYVLIEPFEVLVAIYDVRGRRVRLLEKGKKEPGAYELIWDGTNEQGIPVANGLYFCRLIVGHFAQTRKVILTR